MPHLPPGGGLSGPRKLFTDGGILLRGNAVLALAVTSRFSPNCINYPAVEVRIGGAARAVKNGGATNGPEGLTVQP
jgi:hypothetical protein